MHAIMLQKWDVHGNASGLRAALSATELGRGLLARLHVQLGHTLEPPKSSILVSPSALQFGSSFTLPRRKNNSVTTVLSADSDPLPHFTSASPTSQAVQRSLSERCMDP